MKTIYNTSLMCNLGVYPKSAVTYCNFYNQRSQMNGSRIMNTNPIVNFTTCIELFGWL